MTDGDKVAALRSQVGAGVVSEEGVASFLRRQRELAGSECRVTFENSDVQAGVSAGHVFFRLDGVPDAFIDRYVLRFSGGGLFRQTSMKNQFEVMRTLRNEGLPVPDAVWLAGRDEVVAAAPALIMRRVTGRPPHILYMEHGPYVEANAATRRTMLSSVMEFCARLHSLPVRQLPLKFLAERGDAEGHFVDREITWMQNEMHPRFTPGEGGVRVALLNRMRTTCDDAAQWLRDRKPTARAPALVHGDPTLANVFFTDQGHVAAVLDWELCHEGLPEEDISWFGMAARSSANFFGASIVAMPTIPEAAAAYVAAGGKVTDLNFATALTAFRLTLISALALRSMPDDTASWQEQVWQRQEEMLTEAMAAF